MQQACNGNCRSGSQGTRPSPVPPPPPHAAVPSQVFYYDAEADSIVSKFYVATDYTLDCPGLNARKSVYTFGWLMFFLIPVRHLCHPV